MLNPKQFGLSPSPFSLTPDANVKFWSGMPESKRALKDVIVSVRNDDVGSSEFVLLNGAFGAGKSHALRYFAREAREADGISIYLEDILAAPKPTFSALAERLTDSIGQDVSNKLITAVKDAIRRCLEATNAQQHVEVDNQAITRRFVTEPDQATATHILEHSAIPSLVEKDDYDVVRRLAAVLRLATSRIGENEPAFQAAYLFVDEVEALADQTAAVQTAFFSSLRSLINALPEHFALVLSFSMPTGVLESYVPPPIWERMTRPVIEIAQLSVDEATRFVREYLANVRPNAAYTPPQPFYPFSQDALFSIFEQETPLVPLRILSHLRRVWERAARHELVMEGEEISREDAESILQDVLRPTASI